MRNAAIGRIVAMALGFAACTQALAVQRTFVASSGDDLNPCSRQQPCRTFQAAIAAVDAGGEVVALESAGYGGFTVNKAISIISPPGILAALSNPVPVPGPAGGVAAISVNAGPNDRVVLRGLNVNISSGIAVSGVVIQSAGAVHIENSALKSSVQNFPGHGILVYPGASPVKVFIKDTVIRGFDQGLWVRALNAKAIVTADRVRIHDNASDGVAVTYNASVAMRDVSSSGNGFSGFTVYSNSLATPATLVLERCTATHNGSSGVEAGPAVGGGIAPTAQLSISNCTITNNLTGAKGAVISPIPQGAGWILSRGNNTIRDNSTNVVGSLGSSPAL